MKNIMKLSMLGLVIVAATEMNAMRVMTREMATRGSKLISSHKNLTTAGVAVAAVLAIDAMITKAPGYAKLAKAKAANWRAQRDWTNKYETLMARKNANAVAAELEGLENTVAASRTKATIAKNDYIDAQANVAPSLYSVRLAKKARQFGSTVKAKMPSAERLKFWKRSKRSGNSSSSNLGSYSHRNPDVLGNS